MSKPPDLEKTFPLKDISAIVQQCWEIMRLKPTIILFQGEVGAGKTTFIRTLCTEVLHTKEPVCSPTFGIINEYYSLLLKQDVYHMDLYRLPNIDAFWEIGGIEYLQSGCYCFIEWGELLQPHLKQKYYLAEMSSHDISPRDEIRKIRLNKL